MSLPIDEREAAKAVQWLKTNYGSALFTAVQDTPFSIDNLCGIACQETAYFWLPLLDELSPDEICARCVLDGSGDFKPERIPEPRSRRTRPRFATVTTLPIPGLRTC
jgi:hypothetical protein